MHREFLLFAPILIALATCGGFTRTEPEAKNSSASPQVNAAQPQNVSTVDSPTPHAKITTIRDIDFANFTYPFFPCQGDLNKKQRKTITLQNGRLEEMEEYATHGCAFTVDLAHVDYGDLTRDKEEEAVIYLGGTEPTNSFFGNVMLYTLSDGKPNLLWQHRTGDRGDGGLRSFRIQDGTLVVEEYDPAVSPTQSLCCPKMFRRSYFSWTGNTLKRFKSEVIPNEHSSAYYDLPTTPR